MNLEQLFTTFTSFSGEEDGAKEIAALLLLEEDQFNAVAHTILVEIEKELNKKNTKTILSTSLQENGTEISELISEFKVVTEGIKKLPISQKKQSFLIQICNLYINALADADKISNIISIPIEKCNPEAKLPEYKHEGDAGLDIFALEDIEIGPGEKVLVPTGLKVAIPLGYELDIRPRSGLSYKTSLKISNSPATIDSGFRDEVKVLIENIEPRIKDIGYELILNEDNKPEVKVNSILHGSPYIIAKGERFAQFVLIKTPTVAWQEISDVSEFSGDRGGGIGHSGKF